MTDKEAVRQNFIQLRRAHADADAQKRISDQALRSRLQTFVGEFSGPILAYRPLATEANPFAGPVNPAWLYPRLDNDEIVACSVRSEKDFEHSDLGFWQPLPECPIVATSELALVLVPGLAFDRLGYRLGFGKGHYDRFLKKTGSDTQRVGIGYSFQVSPLLLPKDGWDEGMDWIVTERYVLALPERSSPAEKGLQKWT